MVDSGIGRCEGQFEAIIAKHQSLQIELIVAQHYLDSRLKSALIDANITVIDGLGAFSIPLLSRGLHCTPISTWSSVCPQVCGRSSVSQVSYGLSHFLLLSSDQVASVILANMQKDEVECAKEAFLQGFKVLGRTLLQRRVVLQPQLREREDRYWILLTQAVQRDIGCEKDLIEALETAKSLICVLLRTVVVANLLK